MRYLKSARHAAAGAIVAASLLTASTASASLASPDPQAGYMNWFTPDCTAYVGGSGWGVADLKASSAAGSVVLQPNFNTWNIADPYWTNPDGTPNKCMEANLFEEIGTVPAGTGTYSWGGFVDSNTLDAAYTATAFIKILDTAAGFADVLGASQALPSSGQFTVTGDLTAFAGDARYIMQVGFQVVGVNADPANEAALGNIAARVGASTAIGAGDSSAFVDPTGIPVMPLWGLLGLAGLIGFMGYRRKRA
jgi:hypothetical protein